MGRSPSCDKIGLKKGPWTQEEDLKLLQYVQIHGPSNWRTLPKNAGLQRCGKSCRLRWTNYLRPDIKRGRFSFEEEDIIIQLHSVLGNKWSAIAARLPGRTDNEIKNYWNTNIRKRLLKNGIDPVTHRPRLDLLDLSSILNSAWLNLSPIFNLQTLVHPQVLRLATLLASSSSSNQENQDLFPNNTIALMNQNPNTQIANVSSTTSTHPRNLFLSEEHFMQGSNGQTCQENLMPPCLTSDSQASEKSGFKPSNTENNYVNFDSIFSTPLDSSSTFINGSGTEGGIESYCSKMFEFVIPESLEFDDILL